MRPHAFVAMPFGIKQDIDFDRVYADYIRPALEQAGFEAFRADQEPRAGDIREDMFQELLQADLVIADLSIDNPNVWYELGVRHALRARGVLLVQSARVYQPFDLYTDRKLHYRLKDGVPDLQYLDADRAALTSMARATWESWKGRHISPVYQLLEHLREPNWRDLLLTGHNEFHDAFERWRSRIEVARRENRAGDILVFADESPTWALHNHALRVAAKALTRLGRYRLALAQTERVLESEPDDLASRRQRGLLLGRLGRFAEAREWTERMLRDNAQDCETLALQGRLEKDQWVARWRDAGRSPAVMRAEATAHGEELIDAVRPYQRAFVLDPAHHYPGINAVTLRHLAAHLQLEDDNDVALEALEGGVRWACLAAIGVDAKNYWARATLAELSLLRGTREEALRAWRKALPAADEDWFSLDSSRQQLGLLLDLAFRPEVVGPAAQLLDQELARISRPWEPRQVFLFSGHMLDAPDRAQPRFPAQCEPQAMAAINAKLDELDAGPLDLGICGGACGGDLLFAEACRARGLRLDLRIALPEPAFLDASVNFAGNVWRNRYFQAASHALTRVLPMPDALGPLPPGSDVFERANLWQLYNALACGVSRFRFLCLWDGAGGDGPGGTRHMVDIAKRYSGQVHILDSRQIFGLPARPA